MFRHFTELTEAAKAGGPVRVAVAAAQDREVMAAIQGGIRAGLI